MYRTDEEIIQRALDSVMTGKGMYEKYTLKMVLSLIDRGCLTYKVDPVFLKENGYGNAAIESLEYGLFISISGDSWIPDSLKNNKYQDYSIHEYPDGTRLVWGIPDAMKIGSEYLGECPNKAPRNQQIVKHCHI